MMKLIEKECPMCSKITYMKVTAEQSKEYDEYVVYGGLVQEKLKSFDKFGREFAKTGYCPECQEKLFGSRLKDKGLYFYLDDLRQDVIDEFMEAVGDMPAEAAIHSPAAETLSENERLLYYHEFELGLDEDFGEEEDEENH